MSLAAGCVHAPPVATAAVHAVGEEGLVPPRLIDGSCPAEPPNPDRAREQQLSGVARLSYVVRADGKADSITSGNAAPVFAEAAQEWLAACRFEAGVLAGKPVDVQANRVVAFRNPPPTAPVAGEEEAPAVPFEAPSLKQPHAYACAPLAPPWGGSYPAQVDFTVHRDGRVSDVVVREGPVEIPASALELLRAWLDTCPFEPARYQDKPVSVRGRIVNRFPPDYPWEEAVAAVRAGAAQAAQMANHLASPASSSPAAGGPGSAADQVQSSAGAVAGEAPAPWRPGERKPPAPLGCSRLEVPKAARERGIQGTVLASYVVEADGRATRIGLRNPGVSWILFEAARDWLRACKFAPSQTPDGRAIATPVVQPFIFRIIDRGDAFRRAG